MQINTPQSQGLFSHAGTLIVRLLISRLFLRGRSRSPERQSDSELPPRASEGQCWDEVVSSPKAFLARSPRRSLSRDSCGCAAGLGEAARTYLLVCPGHFVAKATRATSGAAAE